MSDAHIGGGLSGDCALVKVMRLSGSPYHIHNTVQHQHAALCMHSVMQSQQKPTIVVPEVTLIWATISSFLM